MYKLLVNKGTNYSKNRAELLLNYYKHVNNKFPKSTISKFYNCDIIKDYIQSHKWRNKKLLVTHFSKIISSTNNQTEDVRSSNLEIDLKKRLDFQALYCNKTYNISSRGGATVYKSSDIQILIEKHNNCNNVYFCYMIVQLCTSVRFNNLNHLYKNSKCVLSKLKCKCKRNNVCNPILPSCFQKLYFSHSKTGKFSTTIIPSALNCFLNIYRSQKPVDYYLYNKFIKDHISDCYTTHSLRKFVCNLSYLNDNRNVAWKSNSTTMHRFYLSENTKFCDLFSLFNNLPEIIHG